MDILELKEISALVDRLVDELTDSKEHLAQAVGNSVTIALELQKLCCAVARQGPPVPEASPSSTLETGSAGNP